MATRRTQQSDPPADDADKPDDEPGGEHAALIGEILDEMVARGLVARDDDGAGPADGKDGVAGAGDGARRGPADQEAVAERVMARALSQLKTERDLEDVKQRIQKMSEKTPVQQSWLNRLVWGRSAE